MRKPLHVAAGPGFHTEHVQRPAPCPTAIRSPDPNPPAPQNIANASAGCRTCMVSPCFFGMNRQDPPSACASSLESGRNDMNIMFMSSKVSHASCGYRDGDAGSCHIQMFASNRCPSGFWIARRFHYLKRGAGKAVAKSSSPSGGAPASRSGHVKKQVLSTHAFPEATPGAASSFLTMHVSIRSFFSKLLFRSSYGQNAPKLVPAPLSIQACSLTPNASALFFPILHPTWTRPKHAKTPPRSRLSTDSTVDFLGAGCGARSFAQPQQHVIAATHGGAWPRPRSLVGRCGGCGVECSSFWEVGRWFGVLVEVGSLQSLAGFGWLSFAACFTLSRCRVALVASNGLGPRTHNLRAIADMKTPDTYDTPWKTNMEPENPWLVEENSLPWDHCQGLC